MYNKSNKRHHLSSFFFMFITNVRGVGQYERLKLRVPFSLRRLHLEVIGNLSHSSIPLIMKTDLL